jgi:hypothetical protein
MRIGSSKPKGFTRAIRAKTETFPHLSFQVLFPAEQDGLARTGVQYQYGFRLGKAGQVEKWLSAR